MTTTPAPSTTTDGSGLPTGDLDAYLTKLKKDEADLEAFGKALQTKVAHLNWKGGHADTFKDDAKQDLAKLADLREQLVKLQARLKTLDSKVATERKLITNATTAVVNHLDGKPLPANVATELGLQPGYLPPNGSYLWVTAAKDLNLKVTA